MHFVGKDGNDVFLVVGIFSSKTCLYRRLDQVIIFVLKEKGGNHLFMLLIFE